MLGEREVLVMPLCSRVMPDVRERDRQTSQTDVRQKRRLMTRPIGAEAITRVRYGGEA